MIEIIIERENVNVEALDFALRSALDSVFIGLSTLPNRIVLYLSDDSTQDQRGQARRLTLNHDPIQRTPEQQRRLARRQKLAQFREQNSDDLNPADYDSEQAIIRTLAQKIAWLEQELHALRNQ